MTSFKAARRYATSLIQVATEYDVVDTIHKDVKFINNTLMGSRELVLFLKSPIVKRDKKENVLEDLFGENINELTFAFMNIMVRKNREDILPEVFKAFEILYNEYKGIINVKVVSAKELTSEQKEDLIKSLEERTKKHVNLILSEDESLIGGLKVRIDDTVIDGSVQHKLEKLGNLFYSNGY